MNQKLYGAILVSDIIHVRADELETATAAIAAADAIAATAALTATNTAVNAMSIYDDATADDAADDDIADDEED